jgi:hypothetical protein
LGKAEEVLVAEFSPGDDPEKMPDLDNKQGILREYMAAVSHVSELPADLSGI